MFPNETLVLNGDVTHCRPLIGQKRHEIIRLSLKTFVAVKVCPKKKKVLLLAAEILKGKDLKRNRFCLTTMTTSYVEAGLALALACKKPAKGGVIEHLQANNTVGLCSILLLP